MSTTVKLCKCPDGSNDPDNTGHCIDCGRAWELLPGEVEDPAPMDIRENMNIASLGKVSKEGPVHELKTWPDAFQAVWDARKSHELRKNDRPGGFTTDDLLILREYEPPKPTVASLLASTFNRNYAPPEGKYTGRVIFAVPTYITPGGAFDLPKNMVVMSIRVIAKNYEWFPE